MELGEKLSPLMYVLLFPKLPPTLKLSGVEELGKCGIE
jgi:hypothetical protein